jgi:transcriptional regulator of met regulon
VSTVDIDLLAGESIKPEDEDLDNAQGDEIADAAKNWYSEVGGGTSSMRL